MSDATDIDAMVTAFVAELVELVRKAALEKVDASARSRASPAFRAHDRADRRMRATSPAPSFRARASTAGHVPPR
jgi:hypothetical protein